MSSKAFSYANLSNAPLLEELYHQYLKDPSSVETSWRYFFEGVEFGTYQKKGAVTKEGSQDCRIYHLIEAYRRFGHLEAQINPIATQKPPAIRELALETLGFKSDELKKSFPTLGLLANQQAPLEEIIRILKRIYCGTVGIEYIGYLTPEFEKWVQNQIEPAGFHPQFSIGQKQTILDQLNKSEVFETFLHTKYVGQKRFSLEGGETLIPILHETIETGSELGMDEFIIGMSHRGRLNVLTNILKKSLSMVFGEFEDYYDPSLGEGMGDVKYHKGYSSNIKTSKGKQVHVALTPNPSHLESVDGVVEGKALAKQIFREDRSKTKVIPVLIHGDAAIAGQGVVYECLQLCQLPGYSTGGTLHIVINNQIGFTTLPKDSRSTRYCTDIAKAFSSPVFHVNAEDPEGCVFATQLALQIRQKYHCDVFIDLNCYRKYGHNEGDEPAFTQPLEYQTIRKKKPIRELYRDQLIQEGAVQAEVANELEEQFKKELHHELEGIKIKKEPAQQEAFGGIWEGYHRGTIEELFQPIQTAVSLQQLRALTHLFCKVPEGFHVHPKVVKLIQERLKMVESDPQKPGIDWGMGEHLAFASLLWEKVPIRLAGQDSRRGTFSQRHAMWVDQINDTRYFPLAHLSSTQGRFDVYDSLLSEFAALGFEFGYSLSYPSALVLWEAQFGDFANGAQVIMDQYLSSSEHKWLRFSGLVLLLPHGYEGQGPEHSSARIERFLQLAGNANIQVVNPTTPAQYFHLLRRQVLRKIRKPLVVFTPKGLLRHPLCLSSQDEFSKGTFQEIIEDPNDPKLCQRLLLCSGRIFYDLWAEREKRKLTHISILRFEQLYPLNHEQLKQILKKYHQVKEFYWVQEEPSNMGSWGYIYPYLHELLPKGVLLKYVGRSRSASPASGSHAMHQKEHTHLLHHAFEPIGEGHEKRN